MKPLSIIFTIVILTTSCVKKENPVIGFKPNQITTLHFNIENCNEFKTYTLVYDETLPIRQEILNISFKSDTTFFVDLSLNHPLYLELFDDKNSVNVFVLPNDTLNILMNFKKGNTLKDIIKFKGITGEISEYLTFNRIHFYSGPNKNQSPEAFSQMIDSIFNKELIKIDSINSKNLLPKWFVNIEKENISSERDMIKFHQFHYRLFAHNQFISKGANFIKQIDISNLNYYWLNNTNDLLSRFHHEKYDTLLLPQYITADIFYDYVQNNIDEIKDEVSESTLSYFVAHKTSALFAGKRLLKLSPNEFKSTTNKIDNFIEKNSSLITDTMLLSFIKNEKAEKYLEFEKQNLIKIGDKAPDFFLEDLNGNKIKLKDFKNKVVFLNFWGTYCASCINSIPDKNRIVNEYKNEDFVLINICLDTNYNVWKEIIKNNNFSGVQLICKGNWSEILSQKYNIYNVAHYTIIDKKGFIIKNDIRDSIDYYIKRNI